MLAQNQSLRKVTIGDVATLAQVSEATVSRVFNNHPTVSDANREAVLAAASQLGYTPRKKLAHNAVERVAICVGTVSPDENRMLLGAYFSIIIESIEEECRERGINLLLTSLGGPNHNLQEIQRLIHKGQADSLLLVHILNPDLIESILSLNVPTVLLNSYFPWLPVDSVNADAFNGMLIAMQFLLDNGHQQIAFIDGPEDCQDYWVCMRRVAYRQGLARGGIAYDPDLVAFGNLNQSGCERAMAQLLQTGKPFTAVLCCNDESAFGAMRTLKAAGLKIPEDVSVVGHDDVSAATLVTPTLTTVQVAKHDMGSLSLKLLFERAGNRERPPQHILTAERLIVRDSARNLNGGTLHAANSRIMP